MKKTVIVVAGAFVTGVVLGANRRLLKFLSPVVNSGDKRITTAYYSALKFMVKRKEYIEDLVAEAKMRKHEHKEERTIALS